MKVASVLLVVILLVVILLIALLGAAPVARVSMVGRVMASVDMSQARSSHSATLLPDGRVLIAGGMVQNGEFLSSAEIFDPAANRFSPVAAMSVPHVGHHAITLRDGKILVLGGWSKSGGELAVTDVAELFDPAKGAFTPAGRMTTARAGYAAELLPDGRVLIAGGESSDHNFLASCEIYDPVTKTFTAAPSLAGKRLGGTGVTLKDGRVLLIGGASAPHQTLASSEIYDSKSGKWQAGPSMNNARYKHAATLLSDGRVLVTGGSDERDWQGQLKSAEIYDPATNKFSQAPAMAGERFKLPNAVVLLSDGSVLVAGGNARAELFEPDSGFKTVDGDFGGPWYFASATRLPDGRVLVAGGYDTGRGHSNGPHATSKTWMYSVSR